MKQTMKTKRGEAGKAKVGEQRVVGSWHSVLKIACMKYMTFVPCI